MCGVIMCSKCRQITEGTRHHILPLRFFPLKSFTSEQNSPILYLCRTCHDLIEKEIPQHQRLERDEYFQIAEEFLQSAQQYGKVLQFVRRKKR